MIAAARVERFLAKTLSWSFISINVGKRLFFDGPGRREAALRHNTTRIRLNCAPKSALKPYRDETQDAVIFIGERIIFDGIICRIPEVARC